MGEDEKFLLVSLEETKAKKLAEVMSNDTCRKILDYLATHEGTESEISKGLKIPLSTVHYNIKHLVEANLVTSDEFHYSEKGKEVQHYRLANKYIVIAPKHSTGVLERLKGLLPATIVVFALGAILEILYFVNGIGRTGADSANAPSPAYQAAKDEGASKLLRVEVEKTASDTAASIASGSGGGGSSGVLYGEYANDAAERVIEEALNESIQANTSNITGYPIIHERVQTESNSFFGQYAGVWLIIGAALVILIIFLWEAILRKKKS